MGEGKPFLFNVTIYTERVEGMRAFYADALGLDLVFHDQGHIACVGEYDRTVCSHEPEGQAVGSRRLMFIVESELEPFAERARAHGVEPRARVGAAGKVSELEFTDPEGNLVSYVLRAPGVAGEGQ